MELYGSEILAHDHIYKEGVNSLSHLLKNKNDFFFKGKNAQAIEGITSLLRETCKSAYSMDTLAQVRDKFVINTLSGRNSKVLQQKPSLYSVDNLVLLDSCFFLIFNGTPAVLDKK